MRIKYSDWHKHINSISKDLEGHLMVIKKPSIGAEEEFLNSECSIEYKNGIISIEQLFIKYDYENGVPEKLNLIFEFENRFDFFLSINQRDFFDKFFVWNRIRIGDSNFDKQFSIQSSNKFIAKKIFNNSELKKLLINNNSIVFNISTSDRKTKIIIKNMIRKVYPLEEYDMLLSSMKKIIDIVIK